MDSCCCWAVCAGPEVQKEMFRTLLVFLIPVKPCYWWWVTMCHSLIIKKQLHFRKRISWCLYKSWNREVVSEPVLWDIVIWDSTKLKPWNKNIWSCSCSAWGVHYKPEWQQAHLKSQNIRKRITQERHISRIILKSRIRCTLGVQCLFMLEPLNMKRGF